MIYQSISYAVGSGDLACVRTSLSPLMFEANIPSSWVIMLFSDGRRFRALLLRKMERVGTPRDDKILVAD
jgi:hypothetical protein